MTIEELRQILISTGCFKKLAFPEDAKCAIESWGLTTKHYYQIATITIFDETLYLDFMSLGMSELFYSEKLSDFTIDKFAEIFNARATTLDGWNIWYRSYIRDKKIRGLIG
jgi:hypothetical protein